MGYRKIPLIFAWMRFGEGVKAWRNYRGWSQEELAAKSDVNNNTISQIESEKIPDREASPSTKKKIAKALGITVEEIYHSPIGPKVEKKDAVTEQQIIDDIKAFRASGNVSNDDLQRLLMKVARELANEENQNLERSRTQ